MILSHWVVSDDLSPDLRNLFLTEPKGSPLGKLLDERDAILELRFVREKFEEPAITQLAHV